MTAMTEYLQKKLLDHTLGIASWTMPTTVYLSLHTASPGETGSHTNEVSTSGTSYARQSLAGKMDATVLATGKSTLNATVTFPTPTANWGSIFYIAIEDSDVEGSGNMLLYTALSSGRLINADRVFELLAGQLIVDFD